MKKIYFVEVGVLLAKDNEEYDCYYAPYGLDASLYDESYSFYDEDELGTAIRDVDTYVREGVPYTYGIITEQFVEDDLTEEQYGNLDIGWDIDVRTPTIVYQRVKIGTDHYLESIEEAKR